MARLSHKFDPFSNMVCTYPHEKSDPFLVQVWGNLVKSWEVEMKRRPNCVRELVRRGVPQHFRTIAWQLLSGAAQQQQSSPTVHDLYASYLRQSSPYEKAIARDIPRYGCKRKIFILNSKPPPPPKSPKQISGWKGKKWET